MVDVQITLASLFAVVNGFILSAILSSASARQKYKERMDLILAVRPVCRPGPVCRSHVVLSSRPAWRSHAVLAYPACFADQITCRTAFPASLQLTCCMLSTMCPSSLSCAAWTVAAGVFGSVPQEICRGSILAWGCQCRQRGQKSCRTLCGTV
jgi:hypothetical protein